MLLKIIYLNYNYAEFEIHCSCDSSTQLHVLSCNMQVPDTQMYMLSCYLIEIFYFLLGNLPPWMISKVNSVQLAMIVKKSLISKYTMQRVLKPLVEDIKKLVSVCNLS